MCRRDAFCDGVLHRNHFRKDWQSRVKTWFDQPGKKHSRRLHRQAKAVKAGLRPTELLRPAVRCPTQRYNMKLRAGRGFTAAELKSAGIRRKEALSLGIPVDHRRRNASEEGLKLNVERLEAYKARLVVFPKKAGKVKKGDTEGADKNTERVSKLSSAFPITAPAAEKPREITAEEKDFSAFRALRVARSDARLVGVRAERKRKAEEEEAAKKKMSPPPPATLTTRHGDTACLTYDGLDPAAIEASVRSRESGAVVSFVGYTRDTFQGRRVTHLEYEAYVSLALKTMAKILEEARELPPPPPLDGAHPCCSTKSGRSTTAVPIASDRIGSTASIDDQLTDVTEPIERIAAARIEVNQIRLAHLLGPSPPLNPSIVITVASPHRREAFWLTEWLLERVKERVQVWKREFYEPLPLSMDLPGARHGESQGEELFVGRDGEGPGGKGGRTRETESKWKENFAPDKVVVA
ncbi:hypothetical protein JCM10212_003423 [Sporobolomyces blumeae]